MNLIRLGARHINFDLVVEVTDMPGSEPPPDGKVIVTYALGGGAELTGLEALAVRRFLAAHSRGFDDGPPGEASDFAGPKLPLIPPPERREQGG